MNFINELRWRGLLHDMMPGTEEKLGLGMQAGYIGFDPTATSLHIGNLVTIMLLKRFQLAGHKPYILVGGATGMIGDPSGKSAERTLLTPEVLNENVKAIKSQLEKYLDFDCGAHSAVMVNNADWFQGMGVLDFLRDVGKHITVNYMTAKDSVKKRLETGLSFTEFSYQLIQGYDFCYLHKNHGVVLQMGGSDQWGNITTGTELIRRMTNGEAFALTTPLLLKSDGTKFGKSEGGNIWLDPLLTSPYKFYQYMLNGADEDAPKLIRTFSFKTQQEVEALEAAHAEAPHLRILQKALAEELTILVHSKEDLVVAQKASDLLFGKGGGFDQWSVIAEPLLLEVMAGLPMLKVPASHFTEDITTFLGQTCTEVGYAGKGKTREAITAGALTLFGEKIQEATQLVSDLPLLHDKYLLFRKGKKNYFLIEKE